MFLYPSKLLLIITSAYINNSELYELTLDFFALGLASEATKRLLLVVVPAVLYQQPTLPEKKVQIFY